MQVLEVWEERLRCGRVQKGPDIVGVESTCKAKNGSDPTRVASKGIPLGFFKRPFKRITLRGMVDDKFNVTKGRESLP